MNGNNPSPYALQNFNPTATAGAPAPQASTMPIPGPAPMAAPYHQPGSMMNQQSSPMMNHQPGHMMNQQPGPMMNQQSGPIMNQRSGPMMSQQPGTKMNQQPSPMINQQSGPMMGQPQGPMMKPPMQMGGPQFPYPGQVYPVPFSITADVTQCSEPNIASCPTCHFVGMTRVERRFATGHTVTGILLMCTFYLIVPGILILLLFRDYEHFCSRCNNPIGRKKAFCY